MVSEHNKLLVQGGLVYDHDGDPHKPAAADILIEGNLIAAIGPDLPAAQTRGAEVIDASNHLIIPSSWQIWDYQKDLVRIYDTSDPILKDFTRRTWRGSNYFSTFIASSQRMPPEDAPRWMLPYAALQRRMTEIANAGAKNVSLVYTRNDGPLQRLTRAEDSPELTGQSLFMRKFLFMRGVPDSPRGYCLW